MKVGPGTRILSLLPPGAIASEAAPEGAAPDAAPPAPSAGTPEH
jgi:hypothetical protein